MGGFSKERLGRLHGALARHVECGAMPGLVALVSRRGEVHVEAIGTKEFGGDRGASGPMQRDTIFRIASMTKPIAAVAAMILTPATASGAARPTPPVVQDFWTSTYQAIED